MKKFKVLEKYKMVGWTYVMAENEEEAIKKLENGHGDFREEYDDHLDTDWDTLTEA